MLFITATTWEPHRPSLENPYLSLLYLPNPRGTTAHTGGSQEKKVNTTFHSGENMKIGKVKKNGTHWAISSP